VTEEGATTVADDFRDRRQAGGHCNLVISDELLPADLQANVWTKALSHLMTIKYVMATIWSK